MNKHVAFILIVPFLILLLSGFVYINNAAVPENSEYVGSHTCQSCHFDEHTGWHDSLHSKMMRRVDQSDVVVADLESEDIAFHANEAVWSIGSKWEQQFMGEVDGVETLLPGAWLVEQRKWKTTGWDGWQVPEPIERCHGCHTVGLDLKTGKFVEPSVGCESCHGPGSWHSNTAGLGKIYTGLDSQVCGQCHTRGRTPDGQYFFPAGYKPGRNLMEYFKEEEPDYIQNSSKWWSNGHARKRHQEYYSWRQGGHVNSLKTLVENYDGRYGEVSSRCLSCHAGEAVIDDMSESYLLSEVEFGITCSVCHNSHGDLEKRRIECVDCHTEDGLFHQSDKKREHIIACPKEANVGCVGCHMPVTVMNGGGYTLHSHQAGIIPPSETRKTGVPNSCGNGGCHSDRSIEWQEEMFARVYE